MCEFDVRTPLRHYRHTNHNRSTVPLTRVTTDYKGIVHALLAVLLSVMKFRLALIGSLRNQPPMNAAQLDTVLRNTPGARIG
jgi:hypothetical protein